MKLRSIRVKCSYLRHVLIEEGDAKLGAARLSAEVLTLLAFHGFNYGYEARGLECGCTVVWPTATAVTHASGQEMLA